MSPSGLVVTGLGAVVCACLVSYSDGFFATPAAPISADMLTVRTGAGRRGGGLYMAKHVQNKATKKHVKNRPRKSRLSDRVRKPVEHPVEVVTNGNFPGAPPVWELVDEGNFPPDTKASVIEKMASEEYDRLQAEKETEFIAFNKAFEEQCRAAGIELPEETAEEEGEASYMPEFEPATNFG